MLMQMHGVPSMGDFRIDLLKLPDLRCSRQDTSRKQRFKREATFLKHANQAAAADLAQR
jgi:hypothetical protein